MEQDTQTSENNNQAEGGVIFRKPRKKSNKKVVLLVLIVIAVLGIASYFLFFSNKEDNNTPVLENENVEESKIDKELDSDQDGLPDYIEKVLGTDENNSDTDGDGYSDFEEIKNGYNPIGDEKYTEEEWEAVKEEINDDKLYEEIFGMKQEQGAFICGATTIKDIDSNIYETVKIGTQCWLKQNLKVTKDPAGNTITRYCYDNDSSICDTDGGLYDWNTAMAGSIEESVQGICPNDWHIPNESEWHVLEDYLKDPGQTCILSLIKPFDCDGAGTKLKLGGSSEFEGILSGVASIDGSYIHRGVWASFWSSTGGKLYPEQQENNEVRPACWMLGSSITTVGRMLCKIDDKLSVRCLKN